MFTRALILAALLASLLAAGLPASALAQGGPDNITGAGIALPGSERTKFPHIDTFGNQVYVASNAERSQVRLWSKADTATSFPNPQTIGPAETTPDYTTASIYITENGTVHYAWIHERDRRIYLRTRAPGAADFGPRLTVFGAAQPFEVEVAANEDGVFVFWREVGFPLKYRRSPDGANWNVAVQQVSTVKAEPFLDLAAGAGRRLAVAYYGTRDEALQGYVAFWNGSGFLNERIPTVTDRSFANPTVAALPDGGYTVALRSTERESGRGAGVYVADRSPSGVWSSVSRLARGDTLSVSVDADPAGNVHLYYVSRAAGPADLYYTFRRAGQGYGGSPPATTGASPLRIQAGGETVTNVRAAASLRDRSYGHAVAERFQGGLSFGRYFLVGLPVNVVGATGIAIEGGAATTNKSAVAVTVSGINGTPDGIRYSWGTPPTAATPFVPFNPASPTIEVPVPADANPNCAPLTLFTQLRQGAAEQQGVNSDSILLDRAVQADFFVTDTAPTVDAGYTRELRAIVAVYGAADCSGVATATVSGDVAGGSANLPVNGQPLYAQVVDLAGRSGTPATKTLSFVATDGLGNATAAPVTRTIIYDPLPPDLGGIGPETEATLVPNPRGTTQIQASITNFRASDEGGVVAGFQLVISGPPVPGVETTSQPVVVSFDDLDEVTRNEDGSLNLRGTINLLRFLPRAALVPGSYSFTLRVVDAAGNVSAESVTLRETLDRITFPLWVPYAGR